MTLDQRSSSAASGLTIQPVPLTIVDRREPCTRRHSGPVPSALPKYIHLYTIAPTTIPSMTGILMHRPENCARCLFQRLPLQKPFRMWQPILAAVNWFVGNS